MEKDKSDNIIPPGMNFEQEQDWLRSEARMGRYYAKLASKLPTQSEDPLDYTKWPDKELDSLGRVIEMPNHDQPVQSEDKQSEDLQAKRREIWDKVWLSGYPVDQAMQEYAEWYHNYKSQSPSK